MTDEEMHDLELAHVANHDSRTEPVEGCPFCEREVWRRTHLCMGDGESSLVRGDQT